MSEGVSKSSRGQFIVKNIGGISETEIEIPPGVTILTGENATNRTSFLQAIMAAMGSQQATLKGDAETGQVTLDFAGDTITRKLTRTENGVTFSGEGYLADPDVADLFAFLLESNEARRSVARDDDLRELIMRPVDIDAIQREIRQLEDRKREITDEISTIESRERDLPALEKRREEIRERIEKKRTELSEKEEEIESSSHDVEQSRQEKEKLEGKLNELRSVRSDIESIRQRIETQQESLSSLKRERSDLESKFSDLPEESVGDNTQLEEDVERLRSQRHSLNSAISDLQSLIQYNKDRLENEDYEILQQSVDTNDTAQNSAITDQLFEAEDDTLTCWTCGSEVERKQIEETVDRLSTLRTQKVEQLDDIKSRLDDLKTQQREARQQQQERERLERKINEIDTEIDRREDQLTSLREQRTNLTEEVEALEQNVEGLESEEFDEILSLHKEANQLEFEIDSLESDLDSVTDEIEEIEQMIDRARDLRKEREEVVEQLTDERTKIDQIEADAVEAFNRHMDTILNVLEYKNLDRIWIERVEQTVREGRKTVDRTMFQLHVVRTTENGTAYEDTIDHLSESEREVTGLIFALAGYLVHDLHETIPFMLLDSLEAIDSSRIATLVEYFAEYADYLIVALLSEDAQALDENFTRIGSI